MVFTAQHSIDESGQLSWQGDLDIPISYGTFVLPMFCLVSKKEKKKTCFLLVPDKKTLTRGRAEWPWLIIAAASSSASSATAVIFDF